MAAIEQIGIGLIVLGLTMVVVPSLMLRARWKEDQEFPIDIEPAVAGSHSIAPVKFDQRLITETVEHDLADTIGMIDEIPKPLKEGLYNAALVSAPKMDMSSLSKYILSLPLSSMTKRRSGELARFISSRTNAFIQKERFLQVGISEAIWLYSGVPCGTKPDFALGEAHSKVNGKRFSVKKGLLVNGQYTWPGRDPGCKCFAKPLIKGFTHARPVCQ